jgi:hypothetical protein
MQTVFQAGLAVVLGPAISLLSLPSILTTVTQNFANVVAAVPNVLLPIGLAALSPLAGASYVFGNTGQQVIDAVKAGQFGDAINAIVNAPAAFTDAILNGVESQGTVGLLSPYTGDFSSGLVATLLHAREVIAQAITPATPSVLAASNAVTDLPTAAKTVTLSTGAPETHNSGTATSEKSTGAIKVAESVDAAKPAETSDSTTGTTSSKHRAGSDRASSSAHAAPTGSASGSDKGNGSVKKSGSSAKKSAGSSSSD